VPVRVLTTSPGHPSAEVVSHAVDALHRGLLVVIPTETVYGIAADASNPEAVARLRSAKGRPDFKPLPVMVSELGVTDLARDVSPEALHLAQAFWPGPLTLVLWASDACSDCLTVGCGKVGLRCPDHAVAQAVLTTFGGPLALTSANLSGQPEAKTAGEAVTALEGVVELFVDAGPSPIQTPSTVIDMTASPPLVLRHGALSMERLKRVLNGLTERV
jgi:L-threonylcarbamoyladenylate synthase